MQGDRVCATAGSTAKNWLHWQSMRETPTCRLNELAVWLLPLLCASGRWNCLRGWSEFDLDKAARVLRPLVRRRTGNRHPSCATGDRVAPGAEGLCLRPRTCSCARLIHMKAGLPRKNRLSTSALTR
jgi:hypothetical protein